jgi:1,2-phenylacetyl-CoA epoxidase PaaB subunit
MVRSRVVFTVLAPDVAEALTVAWDAFQRTVGDDLAGWDLASAKAEVQPEQ